MTTPAGEVVVLFTARVAESGVWCGNCLLPSSVRLMFTQISEHGAGDLFSLVACAGCGDGRCEPVW